MKIGDLTPLLHTRNGRLVFTFAIFIAVQFVFAAIYFWLYKRKRDNFCFNCDILKNQRDATRDSVAHGLVRTQQAVEALHELKAELESGAIPVLEPQSHASLELPSGRKCVMRFMTGPPHGGPHGCRLEITDDQGNSLLDIDVTKPGLRGWLDSAMWLKTSAEWQSVVPHLTRRLELHHQEQVTRFASFATSTPDVWSYWDFLYFSIILQTTVGLGDILPNSTAVRMIVAAQIVIGYALLIVVLNIVIAP